MLRKLSRNCPEARALTDARQALEHNTDPTLYPALNQAVLDAEKKVPFASMRGWNYPATRKDRSS